MLKKKDDKGLNYSKVNDLVSLGHIILKILVILLIIIGAYYGIKLIKEVQILPFIFTILKILSPLFIGIVIAWLFDPFVKFLNKKGLKRGLAAALSYIIFLGIIL